MANGPRTVTAEATAAPAHCLRCGRTEPRKDLWGMASENGGRNVFTTDDLAKVDHWICSTCFAAPTAARRVP